MGRSILVIDDEKRLAESLGALLHEAGYQVEVAVGGAEGLAKIEDRDFKLVITDLRMPQVDGFQVMDFISKNRPETALIVITGHASTQSAIEAIHQRVADYITKPFEFDYLLNSIEKVFAQVEAEELRQDMTRMISHDIKVPLNSMMGFAQFIVDRKTGEISKRAPEYAEKIILNGQRILALLDNFLTHTRAESGRLEILPQPVNCEEMVHEAVRLIASDFARKEIELNSEAEPIGGLLEGDEHLLFRALSNMLNNACKYTPVKGWATCRLYKTECEDLGEAVVLEVRNSGPGIPPQDVPHIFTRYRRSASAKGIEGSGLGLFVVDRIAKAHGGRAECESKENEETAFRLLLPFKQASLQRQT